MVVFQHINDTLFDAFVSSVYEINLWLLDKDSILDYYDKLKISWICRCWVSAVGDTKTLSFSKLVVI